MRTITFILFIFIGFSLKSQELYLKESVLSGAIGDIHMETYEDGSRILIGLHPSAIFTNQLFIRHINPCGDILWGKTVNHPILPFNISNTAKDSLGNILVTGNLLNLTGNLDHPYILSIKRNGDINFFKRIQAISTPANHSYSISVSPNNEYNIYFTYQTNPPQASVLRLKADGSIKWFKSYQGLVDGGKAISTKDGGLLANSQNHIFKIDSLGNLDWVNQFTGLHTSFESLIESPHGYAVTRHFIGAIDRASIMMLNKDGTLKWNTPIFYNFYPKEGVLRKNGNLLYIGNAIARMGFVQLDSTDGSLVYFKYFENLSPAININATEIAEDNEANVLIGGLDQNFVSTQLVVGKYNDTLGSINCSEKNLAVSTDIHPITMVSPNPVVTISNNINELVFINEVLNESNKNIPNSSIICSYKGFSGTLKLGNDTILCPKQNILLGDPSTNFNNYLWSTGATTKTITVNTAGVYRLTVLSACDTLKDTINISYYPAIGLDLGMDTTLCNGDSIELGKGLNYSNYLWSDGSNNPTLKVGETGTYWLEVQTNCGAVRDSINVTASNILQTLNLGLDTIICPNETIILDAGLQPNYLWSTMETTRKISVSDSLIYWCTASSLCDTLRDSIRVQHHASLSPSFIINPTTVNTTTPIEFTNTTTNSKSIIWEFGDGNSSNLNPIIHKYSSPGLYQIQLSVFSNDDCEFSTNQPIDIKPSKFIIPNIFTPNNDGINDSFKPYGDDISYFKLQVFDRWGNLVFKGNKEWSGRNEEGRKLNDGNYYYEITLIFNWGEEMVRKGTFILSK